MSHEKEDASDTESGMDSEYRVGKIIDFAGKRVRISGFTAKKGDPTRAFMTENLSAEELEADKQREEVILGKIKGQIEANPDALIDTEQARKYWGRIYDESGKSGERMEMQMNELYAQKYQEIARAAREQMMLLERSLNSAKDEAEKQAILSQIVNERDTAIEMEKEAAKRRT